ncbi:aminotransferase class I/II-fold pyridoxal phosphate-dependent enzyme [Bifidobacterium sp. SMB2]|uniref:Aminotransferase n=2 Tax=Bifidobacterium TaxID=1678 RepID=A0ABX0CBV5_9BIFI|nr:aminotransferase class I/II-fold pyridoxal phosphate-dependent enzyme [Bifidobacterium sp. SMB2]NEH12060.1 aminotransferase class I/II-fold pyridoxal phosphate-dependent enzyme [Bifidobacterium saimiriisciurei]
MSIRAEQSEPFRAMAFGARADERIDQGHDVIKLGLGEPDFGAPKAVRRAMAELMDGRSLPYTATFGIPRLREAISGFYRERHGLDVDPARICITCGGSEGLLLAAALTVDPGDRVIVADPSYPCNRELVKTFGGTVVNVPTSAATQYHLDLEGVRTAWGDGVAAVMITSPSNPTGTCIPFDVLCEVCDYAKAHGAWRIVDETYLDLADVDADGNTTVRSVLACDPDAITVNSFSKYFGMTGWRLGWMVLPETLLQAADNLAMNYLLCAPTPVQYAAVECFTPESYAECDARRREFLARRKVVIEGLEAIGLPLEARPTGAFYVYFDVSSTGLDSWTFCERLLDEYDVALTPGRDFAVATADTHVRLSYAASRDALREGLRRVKLFCDGLR